MIRRPPRSTPLYSSAASDVYKRQVEQDLGPTGQGPRETDRPSVGVGGGQREAPAFQPETPGELGAHPLGVLRGQHRGDAALGGDAVLYGGHGRLGRVPRHGAGVPEREVDIVKTVDVPDAIALCPVYLDRAQGNRVW